MSGTAKRTPAQERALAKMRANHGKTSSGEGVSITTMRALERAGLVTMVTWSGADGVLRLGNKTEEFSAELTDAGWGEHERTTAPKYPHGEPTPESELQPGDVVVNVYTGDEGRWQGPNLMETYTVTRGGAHINTPEGCWRFVSRPEATEEPPAERAPLGSCVAWAEGPEERTEFPEQEPEPLPVPASYEWDSKERRWQQGQRAEFKTADGFLYAGEIVAFSVEGGQKTATLRVDTRRAAPASRPMYKGDPNLPGKPRPVEPPQEWVRPLDQLKPA
jgi:hypothetical protein